MPPRRISLSDAEPTVIKNVLRTSEAGLLRLGTLRSSGAARRRQLEDQIRRCHVALAPYKEIPREVWMYIFELCCQSRQLSTCNAWHPPVVLMQVCSAWRQTVLSMPKLWSDVHMGKNVKLARMWLGRAGNIPRALETSIRSHRPQTVQRFICSLPLRKLHLTDCDAAGIDFTRIPVESLLLLEDLALITAWNSTDPGVTSFFPHRFPNLVSLHIGTKIMPRFHVSRPFATWKKLRILRLQCRPKNAECLEILRDASSVEDCSLNLSPESYYAQGSMIEVANMKILRLPFSSTLQLWSFLDHLTFPNLHTLILVCSRCIYFQPSDKSSLLRIAPRIGSLRSLNIHYHCLNFDVDLVLECLPLLQVLELSCEKITTHTAEKIGRGELGGCLRELCDWSPRNLYEFLQACELRRDVTQDRPPNSSGAIASLEKVSVRHSKKVPESDWQRIRKLCKDGIQFKLF